MKLITRDTDYALRALCFIAKRKGEIVSVAELAAALNLPRPFLRKLLQTLNREGLLKSTKGRGGGFQLAQPAEKLYLLNLIKIFQGPLQLNECLLKKLPCPSAKTCKLKNKVDRIQNFALSELKNVTLEYLIKERGG